MQIFEFLMKLSNRMIIIFYISIFIFLQLLRYGLLVKSGCAEYFLLRSDMIRGPRVMKNRIYDFTYHTGRAGTSRASTGPASTGRARTGRAGTGTGPAGILAMIQKKN